MSKNVIKRRPVLQFDSESRLTRALFRASGARPRAGGGRLLRPPPVLNLEPSHGVRLASRLLTAAARVDAQATTAAAAVRLRSSARADLMPELVTDCPRCRAQRITFDVYADTFVGVGTAGNRQYEVFCVCRGCRRATIFMLEEKDHITARQLRARLTQDQSVAAIRPSASVDSFHLLRHISPADVDTAPPPEKLPSDIEGAFREATKCAAVACYNAAGAMFRLCLDLATKGVKGKNLAARLEALCEKKQFSPELRELGSAVRLHGNDAAHDGSLDEEAVEDLEAFATRFLTQLYTEPARLRAANERREMRRSDAKKKADG